LAKLVKELLTHSEKAKIEPLKWHTQAQQRRTNFHHWIARIKDVCAMFKETSNIMPKEVIIAFADKKCIGNRALYQLILSKVDNHCRDLHYHQLFVGLRAFQDESATRFIDRFLIARTSAERAQNEYSNSKLVSFLLTGLSSHKNPSYQLLISIIREKQMSGTETAYEDLERRFLAIDETAARDNYANRRLTSARAVRSDRRQKGKGKGNARANAVQSSSGGGRDLSKLKCYNCQEFGHYARDCPKPKRPRNNETSTASGSSLKRGKSASSHAAAAAGGTSTGNSSSMVLIVRPARLPLPLPAPPVGYPGPTPLTHERTLLAHCARTAAPRAASYGRTNLRTLTTTTGTASTIPAVKMVRWTTRITRFTA